MRQRWIEPPLSVAVGPYQLLLREGWPSLYASYAQHATLLDEVGNPDDEFVAFFAAGRGNGWPSLVVVLRYRQTGGSGGCGAALLPDSHRLFVGAGERLVCYALDSDQPSRLWEDNADTGFSEWAVHGDTVVMSAELELAAWDANWAKLWTTFAEPPWGYEVEADSVHLDVMGRTSIFPLRAGPPV